MRIDSTCNKVFLSKQHIVLQRPQCRRVKAEGQLWLCRVSSTERQQHFLQEMFTRLEHVFPLTLSYLKFLLLSFLSISSNKVCWAHFMCPAFPKHWTCSGANQDKVLPETCVQDEKERIIVIHCLKENARCP